jgi:hypothetical protein
MAPRSQDEIVAEVLELLPADRRDRAKVVNEIAALRDFAPRAPRSAARRKERLGDYLKALEAAIRKAKADLLPCGITNMPSTTSS